MISPPAAAPAYPRLARVVPVMLLIVASFLVYLPVRNHDFVNYDDHEYVVGNLWVSMGLTAKNLVWAFTSFAASNWHPLTWLSHMLDSSLFGLNPGGHHITNVVMHAASASLLFWVLLEMTGALWRSAFVAALFAIHPLNVESVAWIAERKNVLSTFFWFLTLGAYVWYARRPGWRRYLVVAASLELGLLAKPMLVTLPFVLLLLDYWPLKRWSLSSMKKLGTVPNFQGARDCPQFFHTFLALEKLPLIALSIVSSIITVAAQRAGATVGSLEALSMENRLANALLSYARYLSKMVWPDPLAVFYPHPRTPLLSMEVAGAALLLLAISVLVWKNIRRAPYLLVGWLWFLGTLIPVIGLVQVGSQAIADRYTYVPLLGPFIMIVWGTTDLAERFTGAQRLRKIRLWAVTAASLVLVALALVARAQVNRWSDSVALFEHALKVTTRNDVAHMNLGVVYAQKKEWARAIEHLKRSIEINPNSADAQANFAVALSQQGDMGGAEKHLLNALRISPGSVHAHNNLGMILLRRNELDAAIDHFRKAVAGNPNYSEAWVNLGLALVEKGEEKESREIFSRVFSINPRSTAVRFRLGTLLIERGKLDEASKHLEEAIGIDPTLADSHSMLGVARLRKGNLDGAIEELTQALRLQPEHADAHSNLGIALLRKGATGQAIDQFSQAIRVRPYHVDARINLGTLLAKQGNLPEAIDHFSKAVEGNPESIMARNNLGAALVQKGEPARAIEHLTRAVKGDPNHADAHNNLGLALLQLGNLDEAIGHFQAALKSNPRHMNATTNLKAALARKTQKIF